MYDTKQNSSDKIGLEYSGIHDNDSKCGSDVRDDGDRSYRSHVERGGDIWHAGSNV